MSDTVTAWTQTAAGLLLLGLSASCSVAHRVEVFPPGAPKRWICLDDLPPFVLQDVRCVDGICGYTCAPDRWQGDSCHEP